MALWLAVVVSQAPGLGHAVGRPPLDGGRERLGGRLLGDVEVTEAPGQGGDHPGPLLVVGPGDRLADVDPVHRNGRTSTLRLHCFDPSAASLSATSRSGASTIRSRRGTPWTPEGPVGDHRLPTPVVDDGGRVGRGEAAGEDQWPSAWSRSLNTSIAAISSRWRGRPGRGSRKSGTASEDRLLWCRDSLATGRDFKPLRTGAPGRRKTWIVTPFESTRDSTMSSARSGPASNNRAPWPRTTGTTIRVISSTRSFSSSHRVRVPLPCTCSSASGLQVRDGGQESSDRTVVPTTPDRRGWSMPVLGPGVQRLPDGLPAGHPRSSRT